MGSLDRLIRVGCSVSLAAAVLMATATIAYSSANAAPSAAAARRQVGCVTKPGNYRTNGSRRSRMIALTFDGGPTYAYTAKVLAILKRAKIKSTFFIRGAFIQGRTGLLRQELRDGHELANHSWSHPSLPSDWELWKTNTTILKVTGFRPCLFRPPYGDIDSALLNRVKRHRMMTIGWDIDSWDSLYENLPTNTIRDRVISRLRPGAIVLMHDGEGSHPGTIRALPAIISAIKRRHLQPVTVSRLLGLRPLYAR